jgi:Leucine-rich repeat (LRR) protein
MNRLSLNYCNLTSFQELPENLEKLYCLGNQLTSLPKLPENLEVLNCWSNQLTSLPELSEGLKVLSCDNNQLTELPKLPKSLKYLLCSSNQLTSLPVLPEGLIKIWCGYDQVSEFGNINPNNNLNSYLKHHNAIIDFQRHVRSVIWRRNVSLMSRCRRVIIVNYHLYDIKKLDSSQVPLELIEYLKN